MRTALKAVALIGTIGFVFLAGVRVGGNPSMLPPSLREVSGAPSSASFDEAMGMIERDYYRPVDDAKLQGAGIRAAVVQLRDRFSNYFSPSEYALFRNHQNPHFSGIGLDVEFVPDGLRVSRAYPGTPAAKAGIKPGEVVVSVNGRSLKGKGGEASVELVKGRPGTAVTVGVRGADGTVRELRVKRERIAVPSVEAKLVSGPRGVKVGVVALSGFVEGAGAQVSRAVRGQIKLGAKAIVLDLRGNGGGLLDEAVSVGGVFIDKGVIVTTKGRSRPRKEYSAPGGAVPAGIPVAVLVDRDSASASEIVAGAIQDRRRGIVVGTRTFGKGVFQEITELSDGGALDITVGEYFTPSGRNLGGGGVRQGAGVRPDVAVPESKGPQAALAAAVAAAARRAQ